MKRFVSADPGGVEAVPQVLWEDGERRVCRTWRTGTGGARRRCIAVVAAKAEPGSVMRLAHEYALKDHLDGAWALWPLELVQEPGRTTLVLEDPGGKLLSQLIGTPIAVERFLRLAIGIASAVGKMHHQGLIHKDIKPANVLVGGSGMVRLTGFGIASRLPRERQPPQPPELIAGTLAYMSPEQMGRTNRSVDSRSDLYALGVTFYEMLTGRLPFQAADAVEWIHCHLARQAPSPSERVPDVPPEVCAIVMKLLAKGAEDRYQTADGLQHDLQRCLSAWTEWHRIESFSLGEHDIPSRLLIPEKLYGREREIETLLAAFHNVEATGAPQLMLVSGHAGIGKSAIVHELHKLLDLQRASFASGKFDQYKRDVPYATMAQAFQGLIRELLGRSESDLRKSRDELRQALGPNGLLMVDLVPELKLVIGEQPDVPELPLLESRARFQLVFRRLLGVFACAKHPLVLFLDDLQWLDAATLDLLESLLTQPDVRHLLLICAYRDDEVGTDSPLMRKFEEIRQAGANTRHVVLAPLGTQDLTELLISSLHCDAGRAGPLAQLILGKTGGNPFFSNQFISTLVEESLLTFDHASARWCWDLSRIEAKGYTDNVADLMAGALTRLPVEAQEVLQLLACVGDGAVVAFLSMVRGIPEQELHAQLWKAEQAELVVRSEGAYRFVHDRVREAAYLMLPQEQRAEAHLRIGNLLTLHIQPGGLEEAIFEVVAQFDRCTELISSRVAREQVVALYLIAGRRAKGAAAYASALRYLISGAALLEEDRWERRHDLAFQLELHSAECEFLTGDLRLADERLAMLSGRAATAVERSAVACLLVDLFSALDRPDRAATVCLDFLRGVGTEWSPHPSDAQVQCEYEQVWSRLGTRTIEDLVELSVMSDPASLATLDVLTKALVPALITDANLLCLTACRIANLSLEQGNSDGSCLGYQWFGMLARTRFGNQDGFRFGRLGHELVEKKGLRRFQGSTRTTFVQFVSFWTGPVRTCYDLFSDAFEAANSIGDLTYATYSLGCLSAMLLVAGYPLAEVHRSAERALEFARRARFGSMNHVLTTRSRLIQTLRGMTPTFGSFDGEGFDEATFERHLAADPWLKVPECWYWVAKLQARFRAGDYPAAINAWEKAQRFESLPPAFTETAEYHFYGALCHTASVALGTAEEGRTHMEAAAAHHKQLEAWALNCPQTFENRATLVGAELARIEGRELDAERLYERAIHSARANAFLSNEALANELAGRFHEARGLETIASAYLAAARSCYLQWGAEGKVRQLEEQYPQLRQEAVRPDATRTVQTAVELLDLATVTKVLQALSGEIVLEKLIAAIMRLAIEHAGAQRGLLILPQDNACRIQAEAGIIGGAVTVSLCETEVTAADLSESALHYVLRTREALLLHDASAEHPFSSDDYVQRRRARSVLCLPLLKLNRLVGVIYLENNLAPGVFTPARIAMLNLLASEAAASLDHARLYRDLQEREARIRRLVDSNIIGIVIWHADGRFLDINDAFLRIVGHAREDLVSGRVRWTDLTPPEWRERDARALEDVTQAGALQAYEKELLRKDGTRVPVMVGAAMFDGTAQEGVGFVLDLSERKRAEQALREMERETRLIVDTIPGLVASLTTAGVVDAVNKELVEYCGQDLDAMKQWGTNGTVHPGDIPSVGPIFMAAIASGVPYHFDARIRRFDGVYRWCQVRGLPLRDTEGKIVRWYVLLADFDDRKRAENALLASERNLKLTVDTIPALAWSARPDGSADFFNQHFLDFTGLSTQQAADWGWTVAVHPDDLEGLATTWQHIRASGRSGEAEARLRRHDGEYRWFLLRTNPLRDDKGDIVKWYGANTDIEDRKLAEAELRRAYNSFADCQRLSRTGNFTADIVANDHIWSEELYRIFEIDPATKIRVEAIRDLIHPEDLPSFDTGFARSLGGADFDLVFRIVTFSGKAKHVHAVGHLVELIADRPMFIGAIQDVTESMLAEEALSKARSELAHVARVTSLSTLTASIVHEVSQPLSGIITNAGTCLRVLDAEPPNVEAALDTIRRIIRDGNRATEVIARLRAMFSKRQITLEPMNLNEATREVIALSLSEFHRHRVMLQVELAEDLPPVAGDRIQLQQVILNLLRNASEAMTEVNDRRRQMVIKTERDSEGLVRLSVRDAGVGLEPQSMDKLFDAFYTGKSGGMGIGLSVSRSIIERHHGRIWAEPNDGPGANFSFSIPVAGAQVDLA